MGRASFEPCVCSVIFPSGEKAELDRESFERVKSVVSVDDDNVYPGVIFQ